MTFGLQEKDKNKAWVVVKLVMAETVDEALKKEKKGQVIRIETVGKSDNQLTPLVGFETTASSEDY